MSLELIIGPMFSGKSTACISRIRAAKVCGWKYLVVTSSLDTRYDEKASSIHTHNNETEPAIGLSNLMDIMRFGEFNTAKMIIIEESQFFPDLYDAVIMMVESFKKIVVVAGLDGDSDRKPFGSILRLVPFADTVTRLSAPCKRCGDGSPAIFTALRKGTVKNEQISVGVDKYEAMCRAHYLENLRVN